MGRILKLNSIKGSNAWRGMDMLISNTWHWYTHTGKQQTWDYVQDGTTILKDMNRLTAFNKGLNTWARWVELNIDPSKTEVFFQGISPAHYLGKEWNSTAKNCYGEHQSLTGSMYPAGEPATALILKKVLSSMKKPVYLLDITMLSQLRIDGHPSAYSGDPPGIDCARWCLTGVRDTWNHLLYAALITSSSTPPSSASSPS